MNESPKLRLTYIIGSYPLLTTTFIDREIAALRRFGVETRMISIRRPHGILSAEQEQLSRDVTYLLPISFRQVLDAHLLFLLAQPQVYLSILWFLLAKTPGGLHARLKASQHFAAGVQVAYEIRQWPCDHLHAHFADRATTAAMVAGKLLDLPFSFTAHANDIYVNPVLLPEKMSQAKFVATCTGYNQSHLLGLGNGHAGQKVKRIYHGLDAKKYERKGVISSDKPVLLAVGQLKEKKGFTYLLKACRRLKDRGHVFECRIIGEGPLRQALEEEIRELKLQEIVLLYGALPHQAVISAYQQASLFVLPAVLSQDGDRDGIPNVILEAEAMELPVVSTNHSGIPEVVDDGVNGFLVPPADEKALAEAIAKLLDDPALREEMGRQGRHFVTENFDASRNAERLLEAILT